MKISVIIICYNYGRFLEEAVISILKQTFQDFEIIIVDPSSDDNTGEVAKKLMTLDKRIEYYRTPFGNISESRNYGMNVAKENIFSWLDADDKMTPDRLKKTVDAVADGADFIYGNCRNIGHADEIWTALNEITVELLLKLDKSIPCCTVSFKRSVFEKIGYFDENLTDCEDYDYWIRACMNRFKMHKINGILALRRVHDSNRWKVRTSEDNKIRLRNIVRKKYCSIK